MQTIETTHPSPRQIAQKAVTEAAENHAYWHRQSQVRTSRPAAAQAAGLAKVWKQNLALRQEKLAALSLAPPSMRL
jgi:hypothetical protein